VCKPEPRWKGPKVSVEERLENLYRSDEKLWQKVRKQRSGREARDARRKNDWKTTCHDGVLSVTGNLLEVSWEFLDSDM